MKVLVEAYGCALNRGEADEFTAAFLGMGHSMVQVPGDADAVVIFTCGVIEATERHMLKRIKSCPAGKPLLVCGCLPNICPEKILTAAPNAILVGPASHMEALRHLAPTASAPVPQPASAVVILPVASGCLGSCTYCVTRNARGSLRSRPPEIVRQRLEALVTGGAAEVQLCAQDMSSYGGDMGLGLADLVGELEKVEGDFMMRLGMMNPATVLARQDRILQAFGSPRVFKFLHLPVQSGSDRVLADMGRGHSADDFLRMVRDFRARHPGMALSTDIIVGFPGETHDDFLASMEMMRSVSPDIINVTRFSPRPGTAAHAMEQVVPGWKAKERSRAMTELRFALTAENYRGMVGRTFRTLATECRVPGTTFLRTGEYRPVVVEGELKLGLWYDVRITGISRTHLLGLSIQRNEGND